MDLVKELSEKGALKHEDEVPADQWEDLTRMAEKFRTDQSSTAPEVAANFYKAALAVEVDFDHRIEALKSAGNEMEQGEFEKWEDALSDEIGYAERELKKTDGGLEITAEAERAMIFSINDQDLHRTIEAQAGKFYRIVC